MIKRQEAVRLPCPVCGQSCHAEVVLKHKEAAGLPQSPRDAIIEECALVAEAQAKTFLSPGYATNQPFGSLCERFACEEVAKAIRALAYTRPDRKCK